MEDNIRIKILKNEIEQSRKRLQSVLFMLHQRKEENERVSSQLNAITDRISSNQLRLLRMSRMSPSSDFDSIANINQMLKKDRMEQEALLQKRDEIWLDIDDLQKRIDNLHENIDRSSAELEDLQKSSFLPKDQPLDIPIISTDLFAKNLARLRQEKKLSMAKICESTGISRQALSNYLTGKTLPRLDAFVLLAMALDVSFDDLLLPSIDSDSYHIKNSEDQISISIPRGKITTDQISIIQQILNEFMKQNEK